MVAHEHGSCRVGESLVLGCMVLALAACSEGEPLPEGDSDEATATDTDATDTDATDETGDSSPQGPDREPASDPVVPLDAATLALDGRCFDLDAAPQERSASPEGHLWLRTSDTSWRVLDPFGRDTVQVLPAAATALQAWDAERAFFVEESALWHVNSEWPLPLGWPTTLPTPTRVCGDPSTDANGFVLAEGLLYRDGGQWWEWTDPSGEPFADVAWLATNASTCLGPDGELWLAREGGEVWRITGAEATRVAALDGSEAAALVEGVGVAAIQGGALVVGDPTEQWRWHFEAGPVHAVASGGESLWIAAGGGLYRMRDGEVLQALHHGEPIPTDTLHADTLHADAGGGVWILGPAQTACHLRPSPPIAVEGVHNLQRTTEETVELSVQIHSGTVLSAARLDGEPITMEPDGLGRYHAAAPLLVSEGWHTLEVLASGSRGATTRRVRFEQRRIGDLTWEADIEPLFQEHCSGAACHGPALGDGTRPDLSQYEEWLAREAKILDRVVTKGDMPPFGARKDSWGLDAQLTVSEWFETGAARGD